MTRLKDKNILLGVTGSIAAYKSAELIRLLRKKSANVRVVLTAAGEKFITPLTLQTLSCNPVRTSMFSLAEEQTIEHIELACWADLVLIAPASAGIAARICYATATDLLSTMCLATKAPIVLAPAMNNNMWHNKAVQRNFKQLKQDGVHIIGPAEGDLACGVVAMGKMLEPVDIVKKLEEL